MVAAQVNLSQYCWSKYCAKRITKQFGVELHGLWREDSSYYAERYPVLLRGLLKDMAEVAALCVRLYEGCVTLANFSFSKVSDMFINQYQLVKVA